jgi:hypothetical protein
MLETRLVLLEEVLSARAGALGADFAGYRNHAYRVANFCFALVSTNVAAGGGDGEQSEKIALAAAFHDLGIWTDETFDYLPPSSRLANAYLAGTVRSDWAPEITEAILQHHKLTPFRNGRFSLVEPFRRADLIDVSRGLFSFGLRRRFLKEVFARWPDAGFHARLGRLFLGRLRRYPWDPLPMVRL